MLDEQSSEWIVRYARKRHAARASRWSIESISRSIPAVDGSPATNAMRGGDFDSNLFLRLVDVRRRSDRRSPRKLDDPLNEGFAVIGFQAVHETLRSRVTRTSERPP